jgi:hypothetical protein
MSDQRWMTAQIDRANRLGAVENATESHIMLRR